MSPVADRIVQLKADGVMAQRRNYRGSRMPQGVRRFATHDSNGLIKRQVHPIQPIEQTEKQSKCPSQLTSISVSLQQRSNLSSEKPSTLTQPVVVLIDSL